MHIERIILNNFRLFSQLDFEPQKGINLITGDNGSGKSSILEAIYFIVRNRSFRSTKTSNLIRHNSPQLNISARIRSSKDFVQHIEIIKSKNIHKVSVNGTQQRRVSDIAMLYPLGIITPQIHHLIDGGPKPRRRYIDWSVFHVEQDYYKLVNIYQNLLAQRNSSLRQNLSTIDIWNSQIDEIGQNISELRSNTILKIKKIFQQLAVNFLPGYKISFDFYRGWKNNITLTEALSMVKETDSKRGYTSVGPHRCDLVMSVDEKKLVDVLSRGELKLIGCLLIFAYLKNIYDLNTENPILLCDDIFTELDKKNTDLLIDLLLSTGYQIFITSNEKWQSRLSNVGENVFHVEHD